MTTEQLLPAFLRAVLCGTPFTEPLTLPQFKAVYKLAAKHDVSHLIYHVAAKNRIVPTPVTDQERAYFALLQERQEMAEYHYVKLEAELLHVSTILEREGIPYVPLKGAVLRTLYPEPWMRIGCDIDMLVHESDFDRAVSVLLTEGFETDGVRNYHDQLLCCDDVNLELHHNILERSPRMDAVLKTVWDHTVSEGCRHLETPSFFLFHHIAHMAYHFLHGGCGVRAVMDLWLLQQNGKADPTEVRAFCERAHLWTFYEQMCRLADVWFGDGEHDALTQRAESFILCGGAFGSDAQRSTVHAAQHGRFGYVFRVMLLPYEDLIRLYPQLEGKRWKTPYYQVRRWCEKLIRKRGARVLKRASAAYGQSAESVAEISDFLHALDLI